jgi:hypothetical protein
MDLSTVDHKLALPMIRCLGSAGRVVGEVLPDIISRSPISSLQKQLEHWQTLICNANLNCLH